MSIKTLFIDIAAAIKEKNADVVTVTPGNMPQAIRDIETGGSTDPTLLEFGYTGAEQTFTAPHSGNYLVFLYGAAGGSSERGKGGYGGFIRAKIFLNANETIYINVGGAGTGGTTSTPGYNGGGEAYHTSNGWQRGSGGGATHISKSSGLLSTININDVIMVAGGGGGAGNYQTSEIGQGGDGGLPGTNGSGGSGTAGSGGNTTAGGSGSDAGTYGQGGNASTSLQYGGSGGGGGIYGGGAGANTAGSGGGSSYYSSLCSDVVHTTGSNNTNGKAAIIY